MATILVITLGILLVLGVPIAISLGLASVIAIWGVGDIPLVIVVQRMFTSLDSFPLMAVPFFILMGTLMEHGGISKRLIHFSQSLTGHITGGLGIVAVVASLFFGAISGSATAAVAALGAILIPAMIKQGYDSSNAGAIQAISGNLGIIIPPSIPLILYGVVTSTSIGDLFKAAVIPGILVALSILLLVYLTAKRNGNIEKLERSSPREVWVAFKDAIWAIIMPFIVLGGIYGGIFTPTEASIIAVVYSFIIGVFVYREINFKNILGIFTQAMKMSSIVMIIIANAGLFGWILSREGIFGLVTEFFLNLAPNVIMFLLIINLLLLIVGMFFETTAAILILAPLLLPAATAFGIDPIHFGIIMVLNLAIGLCTPPLGVNLFVACAIANVSLKRIAIATIPFLIILVLNLMVVSFIPGLSLALIDFFGD
ncbi:TRAP transporter large permease [Planococcus salinus]|uniref:TRAP transporter large permease n=1 Tax=Planococcus salinus TaxID=1848460 RepID=A0A3M8P9C4_9BACL|nr:TRAP transporter large permease [Planococcus salinus]RNF39784.1 TRAP transporter large permease [Planococcus salinus]